MINISGHETPLVRLCFGKHVCFNRLLEKFIVVSTRSGNFTNFKISGKIRPSLHVLKHSLHGILVDLTRTGPKGRLHLLLQALHVRIIRLGYHILSRTQPSTHSTSRPSCHIEKAPLIRVVPIVTKEFFFLPPTIRHQIKNR